MKQGERKKPKKVDSKIKVKKRLSVFTILLGLFLVFTTISVIKSTGNIKNAFEITDNNWNVSLLMYDRTNIR